MLSHRSILKTGIATLALASLMSVSALASPRSECLKTNWKTLKADLETCKDLKGNEKDGCRKEASRKAKEAKAACPSEQKSDAKVKEEAKVKEDVQSPKADSTLGAKNP